MSRRFQSAVSTGVLIVPLALAACGGGPVADGNTEPVDLAQFNEHSDRFAVISTLGEPAGSVTHAHRSCDIYKLYTAGLGAGGKAAVKAAEVLTSVATLGLAQIVWAPVRAGTRPKQHTVLMCYAAQGGLVEIFDKNPNDDSPPDIRIVNATLYAEPVVADAATPPTRPVTAAEPPPITLPTPAVTPSATGVTAPATGPAATPMAPPPAGTIGLENVSREAIDGPNQVQPGRVVVPDHASADDLNTLSAIRSQRANAPALAAQKHDAPTSSPAAETTDAQP